MDTTVINLKNTTFIIPVRIEHPDRARNAITVLSYLLNNFDTNIIVKEVDTESNFTTQVAPKLKELCSEKSLSNLNHIFEYSEDPVFYRMKIINEMLNLVKTEVVVNYDIDVLLEPATIIQCVLKIAVDGVDMVYPFLSENSIQVYADLDKCLEFINNDYNFDILRQNSNREYSLAGYVQFFKTKSYIEGGMENENFKGSAPEDWERLNRFPRLGYKQERINEFVYHLEHYRGNNSYPISMQGNPNWAANQALYEYLLNLSTRDLIIYYNSQEYLNKYDCR